MRTLVAYVPVLHEGYRRFFEKYEGPKELLIFGNDFIETDRALARDIRKLNPLLMQKAIESLGIFDRVAVLDETSARALNEPERDIILPDEDISRDFAGKYFPNARACFDSVFLRWDKKNAQQEKELVPDRKITTEEFHRSVMRLAEEEARKSADFWRHVAAAVVKDGEVILMAHNRHVPSDHSPYANGDPRGNWSQGVMMELATGFHAEASLIAEAARRGIALEGADMYVTVFPCPVCAKSIAFSGIRHLYVAGGKSILGADQLLQSKGIEIVYVE